MNKTNRNWNNWIKSSDTKRERGHCQGKLERHKRFCSQILYCQLTIYQRSFLFSFSCSSFTVRLSAIFLISLLVFFFSHTSFNWGLSDSKSVAYCSLMMKKVSNISASQNPDMWHANLPFFLYLSWLWKCQSFIITGNCIGKMLIFPWNIFPSNSDHLWRPKIIRQTRHIWNAKNNFCEKTNMFTYVIRPCQNWQWR